MKKFISLALVLAMAFCFSVTAFALGSNDTAGLTLVGLPDGATVTEEKLSDTKVQEDIASALQDENVQSQLKDDLGIDDPSTAVPLVLYSEEITITGDTSGGITLKFTNLSEYAGYVYALLHKGSVVSEGKIPESGILPDIVLNGFSPVTLIAFRAPAAPAAASSATTTSYAKVCPVCGKTNVTLVNGKYQCGDCGHTWTEVGMTPAAGGPTSPKTGDAGVAAALVVAAIAGAGVCAFARKDEAC